MNRSERRAESARNRKNHDRAEAIRLAHAYLATATDTVTGATLLLADGSTLYIDAADARAVYGQDSLKGGAA